MENQSQALSPTDEQALASFNKMKSTIDEHVKNLKLIKVEDETSLAVANQQMSKGKLLKKQVDDAHKTTKEPALRFCQAVDKAKVDLKTPLEEAMDVAEKSILAYNDAVKKKQAEELAALEKTQTKLAAQATKDAEALKNEMTAFEKRAFDQIDKCSAESELAEVYRMYITEFPANYDEILKGRISRLGAARINVIRKTSTQENYTAIKNEIQGVVVEIKVPIVTPVFDVIEEKKVAIMSSGPSNIKKTWNFELVNKADVPQIFLMVDESAVKKWIKEAEATHNLKDGETPIMNGFKFFQVSSVKTK